MKFLTRPLFYSFTIVAGLLLASYCTFTGFAQPIKPENYTLTKLFPIDTKSSVFFDQSIIANLILDSSQGRPLVIVPTPTA